MQEVGGSIPPGSTTLRLRLRVAQPRSSRRRSVPGVARRAKTGWRLHRISFTINTLRVAQPRSSRRRSVPGVAHLGEDGLETPSDIIIIYHQCATRGAATK